MSKPEINIGLVGHVDHGKTTLVKALSGKWTDTHSEEIRRGITIRLGYANATFRKCPKCPEPQCYTTKEKCEYCGSKTKPLRTVSFVDAPGHESLMATMLSGAAIMDGALLLIAANEKCPQPQTREHIMALEIMGIKNVVIVQNKIDVVDNDQAKKNYNEIKEFIKNTSFKDAPIIPISAQHNINIDYLIMAIEKYIKTPKRDKKANPIMYVARSFDINKPGSNPEKLKGGILGGSVKQGVFKIGDEIEIKPGRIINKKSQIITIPLTTTITEIHTDKEKIKTAEPGGTLAIQTTLDPALTKSDGLSGNIIGLKGKLPKTKEIINIKVNLLDYVVGTKQELKVEPIKKSELLMLNIGSTATVGFVIENKKETIKVKLRLPVCAEKNERVTISRMINNRFRLIGYGFLQ